MRTLTLFLLFAAVIPPAAASAQSAKPDVRSHVTIRSVDGSEKRVVYTATKLFEAPNWSPDGSYLLLNSGGKLWKLPLDKPEPQTVDSGDVAKINNDHGISPDGSTFAISAGPIYVLPAAGGAPKRVTAKTPSYFHGWSPDGKTLAYCAQRDGNFDLYAIAPSGGEERRLTTHAGYDDGPDYSPDGRWIYFNSDRSGSWDVWRIPADGAGPDDARAQRITSDDMEDWFPHPSPDGKWLVFLSFAKGTKGHPANQDVALRMIPMPGETPEAKSIEVFERFFGGQGTINVNSWSPDSRKFAYIRYEIVPPNDAPKPCEFPEADSLPEPWSHRDIGDVSTPGKAESADGVFSITGTLDIWGKADGFHYVYQPMDGDGEVVARVTAVENTNEHAKAGVMIRESLDPGARHATMVVTPVDGTQFLRRKAADGVTTNTNPLLDRGKLPRWVKLVRKGDEFTAYESPDGREWIKAGSDSVSMPGRVLVGLVSSSHQKAVTNTSKLDHVSVSTK